MIDFIKVEQSVTQLKNQLSTGEIDQRAFEKRLADLIDYAADGYYWMFGYKTGNWYRHDGQQWVPDNPGRLRELTPSKNTSAANPGSGLAALWSSVNWGWFISGLIILGFIAAIIFNSV